MDSDDTLIAGGEGTARLKLSRTQFRETIGREFYEDLVSNKYSYKELIETYKRRYPGA